MVGDWRDGGGSEVGGSRVDGWKDSSGKERLKE